MSINISFQKYFQRENWFKILVAAGLKRKLLICGLTLPSELSYQFLWYFKKY